MSIRGRLRRFAENLGGLFAVAVGICVLLIVFRISRLPIAVQIQSPSDAPLEPIRAGTVSAADLQKRLDAIAAKKQAIEEARQARIRADREAAQRKKRLIAEKAAKEKAAKEKAAKEKAAKEKAAKEKAAKEKAAKEKAAKEKAAKEKAAKEKAAKAAKAAAEQAAKEKAQQAAKAKAEREKAAAEKAKLAAIAKMPALSGLSSYNAKAALTAKNAAIEAFASAIKEKISRLWKLPDLPGDLRAQLFIRFDRQGRVIAVTVKRSSGYPLFDAEAIRAVQAASPLVLPGNREALEELLDEGVLLNFDPHP